MCKEPKLANLKSLFFEAFSSRPRPELEQIIHSDIVHDNWDLLYTREYLTKKTLTEFTIDDLDIFVAGSLGALSPKAFLYFLPALMHLCLDSNDYPIVFALIDFLPTLVKPDRTDRNMQSLGVYDYANRTFHERFDHVSYSEGFAILNFLIAFDDLHGERPSFGETKTSAEKAIERHWIRYKNVCDK